MNFNTELDKLKYNNSNWDIIVIGGGASGLGTALDAATRGLKTLLLEQHDFSKATSSRSTKLIHGGVRYLAQGNIKLVYESLHERGLLIKNAPHLVSNISFVVPCYSWWEKLKYITGLKLYDLLSGRLSFGKSELFSRSKTCEFIKNLNHNKLCGGILYHDGQFDDSRLAINLCQTFIDNGGTALNYFKFNGFIKEGGIIKGVKAIDIENNCEYSIKSDIVINATGVFSDQIRKLDDPDTKNKILVSQGTHIVVENRFINCNKALMIPKTKDGRLLFAVPWYDKLILGTTDVPKPHSQLEPIPEIAEIEFILSTAAEYLNIKPEIKDIKSVFSGLRPLVVSDTRRQKSKEISRSHKIFKSESGLITLIGGKWTTYRKMAEETINYVIREFKLPKISSKTSTLKIHGYKDCDESASLNGLHYYGSDAEIIEQIITHRPEFGEYLSKELKILKAQVVFSIKYEMARTVEDFLGRRTRALFLDTKESIDIAPEVAEIMAKELGKTEIWQTEQIESYNKLAKNYLPNFNYSR